MLGLLLLEELCFGEKICRALYPGLCKDGGPDHVVLLVARRGAAGERELKVKADRILHEVDGCSH